MRAFLNLRYTVPERRRVFRAGLRRLGYQVVEGDTRDPRPGDIFVTWNRISAGERTAQIFESRGLPVLVTENASWGNSFAGDSWYTLARSRHNTAAMVPVGGPERWDWLGVDLPPFRAKGETVILPQRGIGSKPTAMPRGWDRAALTRYGGRVRKHPGRKAAVPLEQDLSACGRVVTWGSGAAIKALMLGIPAISEMPNWIGDQDNTEAGRLSMFRRLAWAQWRLGEFESGEAFARLL